MNLENSHRFDEYLQFSELLKRLWLGELTEKDIELLNTQVVGSNGALLKKTLLGALAMMFSYFICQFCSFSSNSK